MSAINAQIMLTLVLEVLSSLQARAAEPCFTIHGRASAYSDGPIRIWHIGTHHEFEPDSSSWQRVSGWIEAGVTEVDRARYVAPDSMIELFADFLVCPTKALVPGAVQPAIIKTARHRRYVRNAVPTD